MGDKTASRMIAEACGVPIVPGTKEPSKLPLKHYSTDLLSQFLPWKKHVLLRGLLNIRSLSKQQWEGVAEVFE